MPVSVCSVSLHESGCVWERAESQKTHKTVNMDKSTSKFTSFGTACVCESVLSTLCGLKKNGWLSEERVLVNVFVCGLWQNL